VFSYNDTTSLVGVTVSRFASIQANCSDMPPPSYTETPVYSVKRTVKRTVTLAFFDPCLREPIRQLNSLKDLPRGWDSYGADPIAETSIRGASQLLLDLQNALLEFVGEGIRPRDVVPLNDGGVQMEWEGTRGEIEVEIGCDGSLAYLLIAQGKDGRVFSEASQVPLPEIVEKIGSILKPALRQVA